MTMLSHVIAKAAPKLQPKHIVCDDDRDLGFFEVQAILAHLLDVDRAWLITHPEYKLTKTQYKKFQHLLKRRQKHEPFAYLFGKKEFFGKEFLVNKHVLIPRPDTETLIECALNIQTQPHLQAPAIWDIGTGSGAIAVTLASHIPQSTILATDTSKRALVMAKKNAKKHGVQTRITFLQQNLLQSKAFRWLKSHKAAKALIICANLPYLPTSDKKILEPDITKYEPKTALYSGKDGLDLIKKLLRQIARHATEWGYKQVSILLEYDPPQTKTLLAEIHHLFPQAKTAIQQDLAGRDRVCHIQLSYEDLT